MLVRTIELLARDVRVAHGIRRDALRLLVAQLGLGDERSTKDVTSSSTISPSSSALVTYERRDACGGSCGSSESATYDSRGARVASKSARSRMSSGVTTEGRAARVGWSSS